MLIFVNCRIIFFRSLHRYQSHKNTEKKTIWETESNPWQLYIFSKMWVNPVVISITPVSEYDPLSENSQIYSKWCVISSTLSMDILSNVILFCRPVSMWVLLLFGKLSWEQILNWITESIHFEEWNLEQGCGKLKNQLIRTCIGIIKKEL